MSSSSSGMLAIALRSSSRLVKIHLPSMSFHHLPRLGSIIAFGVDATPLTTCVTPIAAPFEEIKECQMSDNCWLH